MIYIASADQSRLHLDRVKYYQGIIYFIALAVEFNMSWMLLNVIININALLVTHECCIWRSWNIAASENHLWELQYAVLYDSSVIQQPIKLLDDRNTLRPEPVDTRANIDTGKRK